MKKKSIIIVIITALFAVMIANPAMAQEKTEEENAWKYEVTPYLLFPYMNGDIAIKGHLVETDVDPGDIFKNLDFGAMLYFEMSNNNWAIFFDGLYMNLGADGYTPVTRRKAEVDMQQWGLVAAGMWRAASWAEIGLGGRLNILNGSLNIEPLGILPGIDVSGNYTWFDLLIVTRLTVPLENEWRIGVSGDFGGFGIGSDYAWQAFPFIGYRFAKLFELSAGYRWLGMKYETGNNDELFIYDMIISGPEIMFKFHF